MTLKTNPEIIRSGSSFILHDAALLAEPDDCVFSTGWLQQHAIIESTTSGRGESWFVSYGNESGQNLQWVLRHYRRGGMVAKFNRDLYAGWCAEQTRSWKEWRLLHYMHTLGLPVPRPVAARAHWPFGKITGLYRADILLEKIPQSSTLGKLLQQQSLPPDLWRNIGKCLKLFHAHHIYHADLNASNILIDLHQRIYLIDFDRCRITGSNQLKAGNLQRLQRSLHKLQNLNSEFNFTEQDWQMLLHGYADSTSA